MKISSPENERIKYLSRLQTDASLRRQERRFLIEGPSAIRTILENNRRPLEIFWCPELFQDIAILNMASALSTPVTELSAKSYGKISDVQTPQGIAALFAIEEPAPETVLGNRSGLFLCCHGIQDPGNLGTIIRTADAAGADAVIALPPSASFYNPKTVRASAASILNLPLLSIEEKTFLYHVRKGKIHLFAAVADSGITFRRAAFKRPACIVIGSETHGVPPQIRKQGTEVSIPMRKGVESLNAAVAAALLLYQAAREPDK